MFHAYSLKRNIAWVVRRAYKAYFERIIATQDKKQVTRTVCDNCEEMLRDSTKGKS